jgi:hypothetical protein
MHGHLEVGNPDYAELFKLMSSLKGHHHEEGLRQIAIGTAKTHPKGLFLVLYSGIKRKISCFLTLGSKRNLPK